MNETPLIWTSKGNVPIESLRYEQGWREEADFFVHEQCWYDASGELVKRDAHLLGKPRPSTRWQRIARWVRTKLPSRKLAVVGVEEMPSENDVRVGLEGAGIGGQQATM
jgi:hypothetical protein